MAKQDVKINEQQDQSQQQSQQSQQQPQRTEFQRTGAAAGAQPAPSQTGTSQTGATQREPGFLASRVVLPISPFTLLNPFTVMRRMIEVVDPESGQDMGTAQRTWAPPVEVYKTDGMYVISAELPGLELDNVRVEIADDVIRLEGEREFDEESGGLCSSELRYGRFYREIPLPEGAKLDQVIARFDNGMLEIRVPVAEHENRQIPIQTTAAGSQSASQTQTSAQRRA